MPRTEITKPSNGAVTRPSDIFSAMREEMDRMFERFEQGWPRLPSLFSRGMGRPVMLPEVDVHEDENSSLSRSTSRASMKRTSPSRWPTG